VQTKWTRFVPGARENHAISFYKLLQVLLSMSATQWGFMDHPRLASRNPLDHATDLARMKRDTLQQVRELPYIGTRPLELLNGAQLEITRVVYQRHGLIGRGTQVFEAKIVKMPDVNKHPQWKGRAFKVGARVVLKLSWVPKTRRPEKSIIDLACREAEGVHAWAKDHLPCVLYEEDLDDTLDMDRIAYLKNLFGETYEERVPRLNVFEKLDSLASVEDPFVIINVIRQVLASKLRCSMHHDACPLTKGPQFLSGSTLCQKRRSHIVTSV
jgi:hypothetical protein